MAPLPDRQPALRDVGATPPHHLSMRVLVAHNFYRSSAPSGENQLVRAEVALLREGGVEAVEMFEDSDIDPRRRQRASSAPRPARSTRPPAYAASSGSWTRVQPDVVHLHQVTPLISPAVVQRGRHVRRPGGADGAQLSARLRQRPAPARRPRLHRLRRLPARAAGRAARLLPRLPAPDRAGDDRDGDPSPDLAGGRGPLPRADAVHARHARLLRPARRPHHGAPDLGPRPRHAPASPGATCSTSAGSTRRRASTASSTPGRSRGGAASTRSSAS